VRRILLPLLLVIAATEARAGACDDLWFTRNLIIDRAGYCFGSPLGQSMFDNGDCVGKQITVAPDDRRLVERVQAMERQLGCAVDTGRTHLDLPDIAIRRRLRDLPVADEYESGCIGWREPVTPLYAGRSPFTEIVGRIEPGDDVRYSHWTTDDDRWIYVTVWASGWGAFRSAGWTDFRTNESSCRHWAG